MLFRSAADAGTLFDLRCYVREGLVDWLRRVAPQGVPRTRLVRGAPDPGTASEDVTIDDSLVGAAAPHPVATTIGKVAVPQKESPATGSGTSGGASAEPASPAAEPRLPKRVPVRTRPGLRMHLSEPSRGSFPEPGEDPTIVIPAVSAIEETQVAPPVEGLFSGSQEAEERSKAFAGPGQEVIDERERTAQMERIDDDDDPDRPLVTGESSGGGDGDGL